MTTAPPFTRRGFFMPGRKYRCADHDAAGTGDWATGMRPGLPGNPKGDWHERRHRDTDNRFRRRRCHPIPLDMRPSHCRAHLRALRSLHQRGARRPADAAPHPRVPRPERRSSPTPFERPASLAYGGIVMAAMEDVTRSSAALAEDRRWSRSARSTLVARTQSEKLHSSTSAQSEQAASGAPRLPMSKKPSRNARSRPDRSALAPILIGSQPNGPLDQRTASSFDQAR